VAITNRETIDQRERDEHDRQKNFSDYSFFVLSALIFKRVFLIAHYTKHDTYHAKPYVSHTAANAYSDNKQASADGDEYTDDGY